MKLKDVKINAEDLLNFINNNISFEEPTVDSKGLRVEFFYKVKLSDFMGFVVKQAEIQKDRVIPKTTPEQRSIYPSL